MSIQRRMRRKQRPDVVAGFISLPRKAQAAFWYEYDQEAPSEIIEINSEQEQLELAELYREEPPMSFLSGDPLPLSNVILVLRDMPGGKAAAILHYTVYDDYADVFEHKNRTLYTIGDFAISISNGGEIAVPFGVDRTKSTLAYSNLVSHRGLEKKMLRAILTSKEFDEVARRATRIWQSLQVAAIKDKKYFEDLFINAKDTSKYTYKQGQETILVKRYTLPVHELVEKKGK